MNNNLIKIFEHEDFGQIRSLMIDGEPWFAAADIAKPLGYRMASDMTRRIDDEDKGTHLMRTPSGDQNMLIINESGLYSAILCSKLDSARKFKHWVTSEVLPSLRKTGTYTMPGSSQDPNESEFCKVLRMIKDAEPEQAKAMGEVAKAYYGSFTKSKVETDQQSVPSVRVVPKSSYYSSPADFISFAEAQGDAVMMNRGLKNRKKGLSAIYSHMTDYGVNWGIVKQQSFKHGCQDGDSVLTQISVLPEYYNTFLQSANDLLS